MNFKKIGIALVIAGLLGLLGGRVNYSTGGSEVGANAEKAHKPISPISGALVLFVFPVVGILAVFAGIALIVVSKKRIQAI